MLEDLFRKNGNQTNNCYGGNGNYGGQPSSSAQYGGTGNYGEDTDPSRLENLRAFSNGQERYGTNHNTQQHAHSSGMYGDDGQMPDHTPSGPGRTVDGPPQDRHKKYHTPGASPAPAGQTGFTSSGFKWKGWSTQKLPNFARRIPTDESFLMEDDPITQTEKQTRTYTNGTDSNSTTTGRTYTKAANGTEVSE